MSGDLVNESVLRRRVTSSVWDAARSAAASSPDDVLALTTCDRVELTHFGRPLLGEVGRRRTGLSALRHVLRLAAGLESRIIGETHILGQLRRDWADASASAGDARLRTLYSQTLRAGRRVRRVSGLDQVGATYATCACDVVRSRVGVSARVGVIGTGALARDVLLDLAATGSALVVFGRHADRVARLGREVGVEVEALSELAGRVPALDAVVAATSSGAPIITDDVIGQRSGARLLIVDLGIPANACRGLARRRDVELVELDALTLTLDSDGEATWERRLSEAADLVQADCRRIAPRLGLRFATEATWAMN